MSENKQSFWTGKVSVWHIAYIILICTLIILFVLLIAPGRINDDAYHNFSFAATITSIVLAVVSIVYSIQSGISSISNMSNIKNIEESISTEVNKLSRIDETIRNAISPITQKMGDIQQAQDTMRLVQDNVLEQVTKFNDSTVERVIEQSNGEDISIVGPSILYILLYASFKSNETGMDIPFHEFAKVLGKVQSRYCEGLLDGLTALNSDKIKVEQGSRPSRKKITVYDVDTLGDKDRWKNEFSNLGFDSMYLELIKRIDIYYSNLDNQNPPDCI